MTLERAIETLNHNEHRGFGSWEMLERPSGGALILGPNVVLEPIEAIAIAEYHDRLYGTIEEREARSLEYKREAIAELAELEEKKRHSTPVPVPCSFCGGRGAIPVYEWDLKYFRDSCVGLPPE